MSNVRVAVVRGGKIGATGERMADGMKEECGPKVVTAIKGRSLKYDCLAKLEHGVHTVKHENGIIPDRVVVSLNPVFKKTLQA